MVEKRTEPATSGRGPNAGFATHWLSILSKSHILSEFQFFPLMRMVTPALPPQRVIFKIE